MTKRYLNLTNGIEEMGANPFYHYCYVRIQSTLCEQKQWGKILRELDYNFLMDIALGNHVVVIDFSQQKKVSRALFQGLEWIKYCLTRRWFGIIPEKVFVKSYNVSNYFNQEYMKLTGDDFKKIDYISKFVITDIVSVRSNCFKTIHDGDSAFYKKTLKEYMDGKC